MKVFIYATEGIYQGLHGIYNQKVLEVKNIEEADWAGVEMSNSLIEEYGLEDDYYDEDGEYYVEPDFNYLIYAIADEYASMSDKELTNIAYNMGYEDFIDKYCGEELI